MSHELPEPPSDYGTVAAPQDAASKAALKKLAEKAGKPIANKGEPIEWSQSLRPKA